MTTEEVSDEKTYCVTGSSGFIGSHICESLVRRGDFVYGVDDMSGGDPSNHLRVSNLSEDPGAGIFFPYEHSCTSSGIMQQALSHNVDVLVHCAANAREGASQFQPISVTRRNILAYVTALTSAIQSGVSRVVLFSSMSVYGEGSSPPPFDEDQLLVPEDIYAVNKFAMEAYTKILSDVHGFRYVIIRPHNVFGEYQALFDRFRNVVGIWMNNIMRGEPMTVFGDGEQRRAFSYIGDSLPAFLKAIDNVDELHGHAINVGGKVHTSLNELADVVRESMGVPDHPTEYRPLRPKEVKFAYSTHSKSQVLLDYDEVVGWREGVNRMAAWAKQQGPQAWRNTDELEIVNDLTPSVWKS